MWCVTAGLKKTKTVRSSEAQPVVHVVSSREQDWTEQEVAVESSPTIIYQEVSGGESHSATSTIKALLELQQTSGEPSRHRKSCRCHRKRRGGGLPPVHMLIQQSSEELEKTARMLQLHQKYKHRWCSPQVSNKFSTHSWNCWSTKSCWPTVIMHFVLEALLR